MEKQPPPDDRREPTKWEEIVGKDPITEGDKKQLDEAGRAMQRLDNIRSTGPADPAREALKDAQERVANGQTQPPQPSSPIARHYRDKILRGVEDAREQLRNKQDPEDEDPNPPTPPADR